MSDSLEVKRNLTSSIKNLAYELPNKFPNNIKFKRKDFRELENIRKTLNLALDTAQNPVFFLEIKIYLQYHLDVHIKKYQNFLVLSSVA